MSLKVTTVDKLISMTLYDIIRFQISNYCFLNEVRISINELDTLTYLGIWGDMNITDFCQQVVDENVYGNPQTVRNFILKCVKSSLVIRSGVGNKIITINKDIEIIAKGNIVVNMKVYHAEEQES